MPEEQFPWLPVGKLVLNKNPENYFNEVEQVAFGTGVLIDGLDFSDDKMLQGRTFSYSDTQRYRIGANYLQLPINAAKKRVATNQEGGQMRYYNDKAPGQNIHVNYEPSTMGGLKEAEQVGKEHTPHVEGNIVRESIDRTNDTKQAGETYRRMQQWEKDELINNLVNDLAICPQEVQTKMIALAEEADEEYGRRLREGLAQKKKEAVDYSVEFGEEMRPLGVQEARKTVKEIIEQARNSESY